MFYVFSYAKITDLNIIGYGQCWVENAENELQALEVCKKWVKENTGENAVISPNYIIVPSLKSKTLAEERITIFDLYASSFDLIAEIGLEEFDRKRRQSVQREFSKLIEIGEFTPNRYSDRHIPSRNLEVISMLKENNA